MERFNQWYSYLIYAPDSLAQLTKCILYRPSPLTTIRVDTSKTLALIHGLDEIKASLTELYETLLKKVDKKFLSFISKFNAWTEDDRFCEVVFISSSNQAHDESFQELPIVVVDQRTGQSVMRGANVYPPGIITADHFHRITNTQCNLVNVYADSSKRFLNGERITSTEGLFYLGLGISSVASREELMKLRNFCTTPSKHPAIQMLSGLPVFDSDRYSLQNLPSILVGRILHDALVGTKELRILDACAGYGGKTKHLAELFPHSPIIAIERSRPKAEYCKDFLLRSKHLNVTVIKEDITKASIGKFNGIILDPPCSGIGQRPILFPDTILTTLKENETFSTYQRYLLKSVTGMAESGSAILYSTCTLSTNENEEVVSWALENLDLTLKCIDFSFGSRRPIGFRRGIPAPYTSLSLKNAEKCIRFLPEVEFNDGSYDEIIDTIAFFIACFIKN